MPLEKRPSRRDIVRQRAKEMFTGRRQAQDSFRRNLDLTLDDPERKFIWMVIGQGGIGKTSLLRRYRTIADEHECITTWVDEFTASDIIAVMGAVAEQIGANGARLTKFSERYKTYRQLREEIEKDPERPGELVATVGRATGKFGKAAMSAAIPGSGAVADILLGDTFIEDTVSDFAVYLTKKLQNKDEVQLILEPLEVLSPLWIEDLSSIAEEKPITLFFDTYEKTSLYLDDWLRDVLESEKYGDLDLEVTIVIAGRDRLNERWLSEYIQPLMEVIELEPLTDEEAKDFLKSRNIIDNEIVESILQLSGRVPLWLAMLSSDLPKDTAELGDPAGEAIDRFLKWVEDDNDKNAILTCALPQSFDLDIVTELLGQEDSETNFEFLCRQPFVSKHTDTGWVYHDTVREFMLRHFRQKSLQRWQSVHETLAGYFANKRDELQLEPRRTIANETWQRLDLLWLYHRICQKSDSDRYVWVERLIAVLQNQRLARAYAPALGSTVRQVGADLQSVGITKIGQTIISGMKAYYDEDFQDALPLFNIIVQHSATLGDAHKASALGLRAEVYRQLENYSSALRDYDRAISIQSENAELYSARGVVLFAKGDLASANDSLSEAINKDNTKAGFYVTRSLIYWVRENGTGALEDINQAVKLTPNDPFLYFLRAVNNTLLLGEHRRALQDYEEFQALLPNEPRARDFAFRANIYQRLGEKQKSISEWSRAIELDPENSEYYNDRFLVYKSTRDYENALADYDRSRNLAGEGDDLLGRGLLLSYAGQYEKALKHYEEALENSPGYFGALYDIAVVKARWKGPAEATEEIDAAINALTPLLDTDEHGLACYGLAGTNAIRGNIEKAFEYLEQALTQVDGALEWVLHDVAWLDLKDHLRFKALTGQK